MLKSGSGGKKIAFQRSSSFHKYIHGIWAKFLTSHYAMPLKIWTKKPLGLLEAYQLENHMGKYIMLIGLCMPF